MKDIILYVLAIFGAVFLVLFIMMSIVDFFVEINLSCDELIKKNPNMTIRTLPARCLSNYQ